LVAISTSYSQNTIESLSNPVEWTFPNLYEYWLLLPVIPGLYLYISIYLFFSVCGLGFSGVRDWLSSCVLHAFIHLWKPNICPISSVECRVSVSPVSKYEGPTWKRDHIWNKLHSAHIIPPWEVRRMYTCEPLGA